MPVVSRIVGLDQAQATLQHCATRLLKSWQENPVRTSPPGSPIDGNNRRHFQSWLERWEQAFTAYLASSMVNMKEEDVTRCRVLKANHLSCTILASEAIQHPDSSNRFEPEFQAIVELAGAVIQSRLNSNGSPPTESLHSTGNILDVREPLHVVAARCNRHATRTRAIELLRRLNLR
jgi:hypothetical protein